MAVAIISVGLFDATVLTELHAVSNIVKERIITASTTFTLISSLILDQAPNGVR